MDFETRLFDKVDAVGICWLWTASTSRGYGRFALNGRRLQAHKVVWEYLVGPIPKGMTLDHLCRVRRCVNPDHLEMVTQKENLRRSHEWKNNYILMQSARWKTQRGGHCSRGHILILCPNGRRRCKECPRIYAKTFREKQLT